MFSLIYSAVSTFSLTKGNHYQGKDFTAGKGFDISGVRGRLSVNYFQRVR